MVRTAARILDEYLVAAAQAGDGRAFDLLARRWNKKLIAHAWRLSGDGEAAREAAQMGWVEIARGLSGLRDQRAFPAWAYRIVSRICARQIGDAQRRRRFDADIAAQLDADQAERATEQHSDLLRTAIKRLPAEQRSAIALYHFEDMSVAEVAVALNVPAGTVKTRLMHARRKLRAALEGEE